MTYLRSSLYTIILDDFLFVKIILQDYCYDRIAKKRSKIIPRENRRFFLLGQKYLEK